MAPTDPDVDRERVRPGTMGRRATGVDLVGTAHRAHTAVLQASTNRQGTPGSTATIDQV